VDDHRSSDVPDPTPSISANKSVTAMDAERMAVPTSPLVTTSQALTDPASWSPARLVLDEAPDSIERGHLTKLTRVSTLPEAGARILYGPKEYVVPADHEVSVIAKAGDLELIQLAGNGSKEFFANFDLKDGVVTRRGTDTPLATMVPLGGGWYRLSATFRYSGAPEEISIRRLLVIDDADADWHAESFVSGHFYLGSP
jgi:hypothetical protein